MVLNLGQPSAWEMLYPFGYHWPLLPFVSFFLSLLEVERGSGGQEVAKNDTQHSREFEHPCRVLGELSASETALLDICLCRGQILLP